MKNINVRPFAFFLVGLFAVCFVAVTRATGADVRDVESALRIAYKTVPILLIVWMAFVLYAWEVAYLQELACAVSLPRWHLAGARSNDLEGPGYRRSSWSHPGAADDTADVWPSQLCDADG